MIKLIGIAAAAVLALNAGAWPQPAGAAEAAHRVPAPALDEPAQPGKTSETVVLAGGCFWGVQGVFQHVKGITGAVSGYAGGDKAHAIYEVVSTGATGHAESVKVTFDPRQISYGRILQIYFSVAHDPTELDYQGPDHGTQYRSAIFPANPEQARVAKAYIAQLDRAHVFDAPIVTSIEPGKSFFPAEAYHQDFLTRHPDYPYIVYNDLPKIENLKTMFPGRYQAAPVLVTATATN
ncbi:MAG TPA: peptide-methionine (S)-S-oxide reductase MsrA [Stellaceae bacterium]|jgi:peptide-methionine (S)-S-oxide reductase|nr:peptide-methionine (S)-S-oxide reductase MsrA [Stellaceae bacterium]